MGRHVVVQHSCAWYSIPGIRCHLRHSVRGEANQKGKGGRGSQYELPSIARIDRRMCFNTMVEFPTR